MTHHGPLLTFLQLLCCSNPCAPRDAACFCDRQPSKGYYTDYGTGCKGFYVCLHAASKYVACPLGQLYNPNKAFCEKAWRVECVAPRPPIPSPPPLPLTNAGLKLDSEWAPGQTF